MRNLLLRSGGIRGTLQVSQVWAEENLVRQEVGTRIVQKLKRTLHCRFLCLGRTSRTSIYLASLGGSCCYEPEVSSHIQVSTRQLICDFLFMFDRRTNEDH